MAKAEAAETGGGRRRGGPFTLSAERRRALLGLAHRAAALLGMDEETRRAAQAAWCGKASLRDFSDRELIGWLHELKARGAPIGIPAPPPWGGNGWDRPSEWQRVRMEQLAARLGLDEQGFAGFVRRTTGVDDPRFLTHAGAQAVLHGLSRWARQRGLE